MKKLVAFLCVLCLVAVLAVGFAACKDDQNDQPKAQYTVMTPDGAPAMALAYMMKTNATIDGHAISYQVIDGANVAPSMTKGEADFIIAPTNAGVMQCFNTNAYQLMATTSWGNLYILSIDPSLKPLSECESAQAFLAQFAGKTIESIGINQVPDKTLNYLLGVAQLTDVTVANGGDAINIQSNLRDGKIETAVLGEPAVTGALSKATGAVRLASVSDLWKQLTGLEYPQASLFVKKSIVENDPAAVQAMATAVKASIAYLNESSEHALELGNYMASRGDSSLQGAVVSKSYLAMSQQYKSAQEVQEDVKKLVSVLMPSVADKDFSSIFVR